MASAGQEIFLSSITKRFGGVLANDRIDLTLRRGEIHALLGENGAGKSTLMNILSGLYLPDSGEIIMEGERVRFRSPWDAVCRGIGMVHQHFQLVEAFSVLDNILLGTTDASLRLNRRQAAARIEAVARQHGLHVDPKALIWQLTVGQRQKVEILKLLYRGADLLLLDEPTAMLTPAEADDLYLALRQLADAGKYVVLITHKLREVAAAADRVTILRRGRVVASLARSEASIPELGALMIGATLPELRPFGAEPSGDTVLKIEGAQAEGGRGATGLKGVSLELRRGEILGIAGVAGNGQVELAEGIAAIRPWREGRIWLDGVEVTRLGALGRMRAGLRFVPEDRSGTGLVPQLDITDNTMLRDYREPFLSRGFWIDRRAGRARAQTLMRDYDVRAPGIDVAVGTLSGGNQQKILVGRELLARPTALVIAQPSRGLDIAATRAVHERLLELRAGGAGVMVISEDLDELLQLSDRVAVLYDGCISRIWGRQQANRSDIGAVMGGHLLETA